MKASYVYVPLQLLLLLSFQLAASEHMSKHTVSQTNITQMGPPF